MIDLESGDVVHRGNKAIAVTYEDQWGSLYLKSEANVVSDKNALRFWIHGGTNAGQRIRVNIVNGDGGDEEQLPLGPLVDDWREVTLMFADLGNFDAISGIKWQDATGGSQPTFYIDDIEFVNATPTPTPTATGTATFTATTPTPPTPTNTAEVTPTPTPTHTSTSTPTPMSTVDGTVFDDALSENWANSSWKSIISFEANDPVSSSNKTASVQYTEEWGGFFVQNREELDAKDFLALSFRIHGGENGGQKVKVRVDDSSAVVASEEPPFVELEPLSTEWQQVVIPLSQFGNLNSITGLKWQDSSGGAQAIFYIDDIELVVINSRIYTPLVEK